ncbi:hypothetical protein LVJ83_12355 [Uruburuella testudinis]|uniref:Secreted protein n=1 Tax=Uruburuella testudinis TaxID=1282863 RepID=A0ABY4DSY3_9NEIS|nr:hypothetical protein [Uruburuella testudinis]UOO81697.1 hypothetical protein LVJ83_12355 [Uruburuella testudinis]
MFAVTRVFTVACFCRCAFWLALFSRQPYRFSNLTPSPAGEGWGEGGKPQVCFIAYSVIIIFRRPDHYSSLAACALSLTLSHGRGNSVTVVFAVTRFFYRCVFLPLRILAGVIFPPTLPFQQPGSLPCGGGLGRGRQTAGLLHCAFRHHHFQTASLLFKPCGLCPLPNPLPREREFGCCCFCRYAFLPLRILVGVYRQSYRFSRLTPSPAGEGWGEGGKPQVCFISYSVIIIFRRPDRYASLTACALSLTLSRGRGNSVAVVFTVACFCRCAFWSTFVFPPILPLQPLDSLPCGGGLGRGRQTAGLLYRVFRHHHFQTA